MEDLSGVRRETGWDYPVAATSGLVQSGRPLYLVVMHDGPHLQSCEIVVLMDTVDQNWTKPAARGTRLR